MPNPFTQYTSEQVGQINILPAVGQISEMLRKGIADFGQGVGEAYTGYKREQAEHDIMAQNAITSAMKYLRQDPNDDSGRGDFEVDSTAPSHTALLIKEAFKAGGNDWSTTDTAVKGMAGIDTNKLRAWMGDETKYKVEKQQEFDNDIKGREMNAREKTLQLAEQDAQRKDAEFQRGVATQKALIDIEREKVATTAIGENKVVTKHRIGDLYAKDGTLLAWQTNIESVMAENGLKDSDVVTRETHDAQIKVYDDYPSHATAQHFAGIADTKVPFNPELPLKDNQELHRNSGATEKFIRNAFKVGTELESPALRAQAKVFFPEGFSGPISNMNGAYAMAKNIAKTKPVQERLAKNYGVGMVPNGAVFDKAWVDVTGTTDSISVNKIEVPIHPDAQEKARYDAVSARMGDKMPFSFEQFKILNVGHRIPWSYDGQGNKVVQVGKGANERWIPYNNLSQVTAEAPKNQFEQNRLGTNTWLQGHAGKGLHYGPQGNGFTLVYNGTIDNLRSPNPVEDSQFVSEGLGAVVDIRRIGAEMKSLINGAGVVEKNLSVSYNQKYENLSLQAQTYRKYFIASGQETDKDNARLTTMVTDNSFLKTFTPAEQIEIINAMERIIGNKILGKWTAMGGKVLEDKPNAVSKETMAKMMKYADKAGIPTFEELKARDLAERASARTHKPQ